MKKKLKSVHGASMVEFAIILPVLILILFGIIEFGLLLFNKQVITNASREGARFGIVARSPRYLDEEITTVVTNYTGNNLITFGTKSPPSVKVTRVGPGGGLLFGDDLTVQVTYRYEFLILPNFATVLVGGIDLNAVTTMKNE